jgi:hypothetical protein
MIVFSTPGSITWESKTGRRIIFWGEWTLEPKFYVDLPQKMHWDDGHLLSDSEKPEVIKEFLSDASTRGWILVFP